MKAKFLLLQVPAKQTKVLDILRSDPLGRNSAIIGEIVPDNKKLVILNTSVGGKRILDMLSGEQLPRIC